MSEVKYISTISPSLRIKLSSGRHQAVNGVFTTLTDQDKIELDALLKKQPSLRAQVRRVDMEEAAQKAKEMLAKQPPAAVKGVVTSGTSAAAKIREAREANKPENLTGSLNPVNVKTNEKDDKPMDVQQIPTTPPASGSKLLDRLKK
jgi:hypothetical protein